MKRCHVLIPFQGDVLTVEELGGISSEFICFNPDRSNGRPDYKIHLTENMLLRFEGETKLISILDYTDEFTIINSKGEELTNSTDTNPDFVTHLVDDIFDTGGKGVSREDLN